MSALLAEAVTQAKRPPQPRTMAEAETRAYLESDRTGRAVTWHRPGGKVSEGGIRADAGTYRPGALMALATRAAKTAARRYPQADLDDLTMDLVEAALSKAPQGHKTPGRGKIGTDPTIQSPLERDRAYLVGIARHRLADECRHPRAETESLDRRISDLGELPSMSNLIEQSEAQAHTDPNLVNPDADPVNRDVMRAAHRFPTKDAGRAALANLIGSGATRAQLARQAGLRATKDWHRSVKRGKRQLARLVEPVHRWTAKDWAMAEALAHLVTAHFPDSRGGEIENLLAQAPPTYREPNLDRPWRTEPDTEAQCAITEAQPTRARRVLAYVAALQRITEGREG